MSERTQVFVASAIIATIFNVGFLYLLTKYGQAIPLIEVPKIVIPLLMIVVFIVIREIAIWAATVRSAWYADELLNVTCGDKKINQKIQDARNTIIYSRNTVLRTSLFIFMYFLVTLVFIFRPTMSLSAKVKDAMTLVMATARQAKQAAESIGASAMSNMQGIMNRK